MGCGCGKKKTGTIHFMGQANTDPADPVEWGPVVWKYLHIVAEKLGTTGNSIVNTDLANYYEVLITTLHLILPCTECQGHTASYIAGNPFPSLKTLPPDQQRVTARNWLFNFHNHVRRSKGQEITLNSPEECAGMYAHEFVPKCEYTYFVKSVAYAVSQGWVRVDIWRKWYSNSERVRILAGNIVT